MFKLHLRYLLSKFNLITILLISIIYLISLLLNIGNIPSNLDANIAYEMYFYNVFSMLKFILLLLVIFLMCLSGIKTNDGYQLFLIDRRSMRIKYYLTKMGALFLIISFIVICFGVLYILVGLIGSDWYFIKVNDGLLFLNLWLLSLMYGLLAYNLVKVFNTLLIGFIPCVIIVIEETFSSSDFIKTLTYFFPILEYNKNIESSYGLIHIIVLVVFNLLLGLIKDYTLDIK